MTETLSVVLTDTAVKRHAADHNVRQLRDPRYPIKLRYHKDRSRATLFLVQNQGGKTRWRKMGTWPQLSVKALIIKLPDVLAGIAANIDANVTVTGWTTTGEVLKWYGARMHNDRLLSDSRRKTVASAINKHLIPMLSDLPLSELNHDSIDKLFWMPLQAKYELASIKAWFSMLKRSTKEATAFKLLEVDPMVGITFGNFTTVSIQPRTGRLRPQQVSQLFKELKPVPARNMALFMLLLLCGTRIGETRRAKWAHMDNEGWYIPPEHTKTRSMHRLPMTPVLARVLAWWRPQATGSFVFPANNKRCLSATEASTLMRDLSNREWTAHDLRKLARTCWADLGVDYMVGELLLNHTLSRLDQTYIHTHAEKQKKIALESHHQWLLDHGLDDLLKGLEAETIARREKVAE